jgi:hypothetical protein
MIPATQREAWAVLVEQCALSRDDGRQDMSEPLEPVHLFAEVDLCGHALAGVAGFQGRPHLFVSEGLDVDRPRARRRLGQTFFLLPVPREEVEALLRKYHELESFADGATDRKERAATCRAVWVAFKTGHLQAASGAWRARGSFPSAGPHGAPTGEVRWKLLRKRPIPGQEVRARLARVEELERALLGESPGEDGADELPF